MKKTVYIMHAQAASAPESAMLPAVPCDTSQVLQQREIAPRRKGSAAGRAILHEPGVMLPGVECPRRMLIR